MESIVLDIVLGLGIFAGIMLTLVIMLPEKKNY